MEHQKVDVLVVLRHRGSKSHFVYAEVGSMSTSALAFAPTQLSLVQCIGNMADGILVRLR